MKRVDILHFDGCPNTAPTVARVRAVAHRMGIEIDLRLVAVETVEAAMREHFLGSPTVRIDGVDIDAAAPARSDFGLSCRVYGREGTPPAAMIAASLSGQPFREGQLKGQGLATAGALVAAILSSACCWLPLLLIGLGLSAGGLAVAFEPLRPWFIAIAAILLGFGTWWTERSARVARACGCPQSRSRRALNRGMLGLSALGVLAFTFFPQYVNKVFGPGASEANAAQSVTLRVEGMTCAGCEAGIEAALLRLPGVVLADASYANGVVVVGLQEGADVATTKLVGAVESAGYEARGTEAEAPPTVKVLKDELRPLSRYFNGKASTTRFLAILSPT